MAEVELKAVNVSGKGQIAIPADIRKTLDIKKGDKLIIAVKGHRLLIEKSDAITKRMKKDFGPLVKLSQKTAKKLWDNDYDKVWDQV